MPIVKTDSKHYTNIANAIREKTESLEMYTPEEMPEGIDLVYDTAKNAENDAFWDVIQQHGTRTTYAYAFTNWEIEYIRPKYKVVPTSSSMSQTFLGNPKLKKIEAEYFDFSQVPIPAYAANGEYYTFYNCVELEEIEDIGLLGYYYTTTFANCKKLHTIGRLPFREDTVINAETFMQCFDLANVIIDGVIPTSVDMRYSTKLSHDSLMSIINALKDYSADTSGTIRKLTIGSGNIAKLTQDELEIIYNKGWNVA